MENIDFMIINDFWIHNYYMNNNLLDQLRFVPLDEIDPDML